MNSQQPEFVNPPFGNLNTLRYLNTAVPASEAGTNARRFDTQKGSLYDTNDRKEAIEFILRGEGVALFNVGVGALLGAIPLQTEKETKNPRLLPKFVQVVNETKGEKRIGKPLAGALPTSEFIQYIDFEKIKPEMRAFFREPKNIIDRLGSLCFIRAPITEDAVRKLPPEMVERDPKTNIPYFQNWDPHGNPPLEHISKSLVDAGMVPAITSLNTSGVQSEIVTLDESYAFSKEKNLPLFLSNEPTPLSNPILSHKNSGTQKGSFTILGLGEEGITLIRDGTLPSDALNFLLSEVPGFVDFTAENVAKAKPHKYDQHKIPQELLKELTPIEGRTAILAYLNGEYLEALINRMHRIHDHSQKPAA